MLFSGLMFFPVFCILPFMAPFQKTLPAYPSSCGISFSQWAHALHGTSGHALWSYIPDAVTYPFMRTHCVLFGFTATVLHRIKFYCSSLGFNCSPSSFSLAKTSSRDLRPRLRTFIISSEVLFVNSSTVLIPALFKQL